MELARKDRSSPVAARLAGVPYVVHVVHGYMIQHHRARPVAKILGLAHGKAFEPRMEPFLSCAEPGRFEAGSADYGIIGKKRIKYLGNGVDVGAFDPLRISSEQRIDLRKKFGIPDGAAGRPRCRSCP